MLQLCNNEGHGIVLIKCQNDSPRVRVVAVLDAVVSDCDGDNSGGSKLMFPGLDTVHNKINRLARVCMVQKVSHCRITNTLHYGHLLFYDTYTESRL
jgi:hypothetical protein